MSRSVKKAPVMGMTSGSGQKEYRTQENRAKRKKVSQLLRMGIEELPHEKEYGDEWLSPRDGKQHFGDNKNKPCCEFCKESQHIFCHKAYLKWLRK